MIVSVPFAECDGCGLRVELDHMPDTWRTVQQNGKPDTMFCTSACYASGDGVPREIVVDARRRALHLVPNEVAILACLARGLSRQEVGAELGFAESTIKNYLSHTFDMLGTRDQIGAVLVAGHLGLVDLPALGAQIRRTMGP